MTSLPDVVVVAPSQRLEGSAELPGDKSVSHRALMLSAYAEGTSSIEGLSPGADVTATLRIVEALGAHVSREGTQFTVEGGRDVLHASSAPLDCENSGTGMRLLIGFVAGIPGRHHLVGDASLSTRPMDRVAAPLHEMGAVVTGHGERLVAPITVKHRPLRGISYHVPVPSAQVKSAILLAGLWAEGMTTVTEATPTRPNTEEMIREAGGDVTIEASAAGRSVTVRPGPLRAHDWRVPRDPSQAAFFVVAGLLATEGVVSCPHLYGDHTRIGYLSVLQRMGASVSISNEESGLVTVAVVPSELVATTIDAGEIPSLDEVPILAVAAAAAEGQTRFRDVGELRIKESDRFARTIELVTALGATAHGHGDDLIIDGLGSARKFAPLVVAAHEDHRMAMAAAIAGLVGSGAEIHGFATVASSFPTFLDVVASLS